MTFVFEVFLVFLKWVIFVAQNPVKKDPVLNYLFLASLVATPYVSRLRVSRPRESENFKVTHIAASILHQHSPNTLKRQPQTVWKLQGYAYPGQYRYADPDPNTLKTSRLRISRPASLRRSRPKHYENFKVTHIPASIVSQIRTQILWKLQGYAYPGQDPFSCIILRLNMKLGLSDCSCAF